MFRVLLGFVAGVYADQTYKLPHVETKVKEILKDVETRAEEKKK